MARTGTPSKQHHRAPATDTEQVSSPKARIKPNAREALSSPPDFFAGGGEMTTLIRQTDWSRTPLGPIETWPQSLRTTVSLCLASNFPINIVWGPEHTQIYNDGYRVCLRRCASAGVRRGLQNYLGERLAGHRGVVRASAGRRGDVSRKPADVPQAPERLPRGDLFHLFAFADPRRERRRRRPFSSGDRDDGDHACRAPHPRVARPHRQPGRCGR